MFVKQNGYTISKLTPLPTYQWQSYTFVVAEEALEVDTTSLPPTSYNL